MKRSRQVSLVLMGSAAALVTLSGCDVQPDPALADNGGTFTSMAECVAVYDQQTCQSAQQLAQKEHFQNAPKFSSYEQCVQQFGPGGCANGSSYGGGSNVFLPLMAGYMLGSATSTPAPLYYGPGSWRHRNERNYSAPIFTSGRGYNSRAPIGQAPFASKATAPITKGGLKSGTAISTGTVPTQRGGFGSSFKPTKSFTSNYATTNPTSFGRATLPSSSARFSSVSSSRSAISSSSISSRGGFGGSGRSFGGGFGG